MRANWTLLQDVCREHMDGGLSDERMRACLSAIAHGQPLPARGQERPKTDGEVIATWRRNDQLGQQIRSNPGAYHAGRVLLAAFDGFRAKREADHPSLAARYHAGRP